jgi:hypothetical protein
MKTTVLALSLIATMGLAQPAAFGEPTTDDPVVAAFERTLNLKLRAPQAPIYRLAPAGDVLAESFARTLGITVDGAVQPTTTAALERVAVRR